RIALARGVLLGLAVGMIGMATPYISKLLIDRVYPTADVGFMHVLGGAIAGISVASAVLGAIRGYYTQVGSPRMNAATGLLFFAPPGQPHVGVPASVQPSNARRCRRTTTSSGAAERGGPSTAAASRCRDFRNPGAAP